ncbi:hypothetical protein BC830DRAFT_1165987 [Chytriomyces sp. MP71]|nr:hypothetical protein BC830DRAFT_1165987 [Chytriomyces sp. MP71]
MDLVQVLSLGDTLRVPTIWLPAAVVAGVRTLFWTPPLLYPSSSFLRPCAKVQQCAYVEGPKLAWRTLDTCNAGKCGQLDNGTLGCPQQRKKSHGRKKEDDGYSKGGVQNWGQCGGKKPNYGDAIDNNLAPLAPAVPSILPAHLAPSSEYDLNRSLLKSETTPHRIIPSKYHKTPQSHSAHTTTHTTTSTQAMTLTERLNTTYHHATPAPRGGALVFVLLALSALVAYCTHACIVRRIERETCEEAIQRQIYEQRARVGHNAEEEVGTRTISEQESLEEKNSALRS